MNASLMLLAAVGFLAPIATFSFDFPECNCRMRGYFDATLGQIVTGCPPANCRANPQTGSPKAPCLQRELTYGPGDIRLVCICVGNWGGGLWSDFDCGCQAWRKLPGPGSDGCDGVQCYECHWVDPTTADLADVCECSK